MDPDDYGHWFPDEPDDWTWDELPGEPWAPLDDVWMTREGRSE
jgi:hypothetical protein